MTNSVFNTPPNWPTPPNGWVPPADWQPDPAWGPAPAGWNFWIEPAVPAAPTNGFPKSNTPFPTAVAPTQFPTPNTHAQPVYSAAPMQSPASFHPAPKKKLSKVAVIAMITAAVLVLGGGVYGVSAVAGNFLSTGKDDAAVDPDILPTPATMEEALVQLDEVYADVQAILGKKENGYDFRLYESIAKDTYDEAKDTAASGEDYVSPDLISSGYAQNLVDLKDDIAGEQKYWAEAYDADKRNAEDTNESGTEAEAALDKISGGISIMEVNTACADAIFGSEFAIACVINPMDSFGETGKYWIDTTTVNLTEKTATDDFDWDSVMRHEFAHVIQHKYWYNLVESPSYINLFNSDVEHQADCMSMSVMPDFHSYYGFTCTPEQLAAARQVWDGVLP